MILALQYWLCIEIIFDDKKSKRTLSFASKPSSPTTTTRNTRRFYPSNFTNMENGKHFLKLSYEYKIFVSEFWMVSEALEKNNTKSKAFFESSNFTSRRRRRIILYVTTVTPFYCSKATKQGIHKSNRLPAL